MSLILSLALRKEKFYLGRMISPSKSAYRRDFPNHVVIFNAVIRSKDNEEWYGDLDLTNDLEKIKEISKENNFSIKITTEFGHPVYGNKGGFNEDIKDKIKESNGKCYWKDK